MRNFLIDTDTASDDAVAILMALSAPDVRVLGLTTVAGNVGLEQATRNALLTVEICGLRCSRLHRRGRAAHPRARPRALVSRHATASAIAVIPPPRRAPEREHAVDAILRLADAEPGLTLVTLGPLTNIALALARDPAPRRQDRPLRRDGRRACCEGNVTPAAEYNIWVDPEAARIVFRSGLPIEMVGWHVSRGASVLNDAEIADDSGARHGEGALRHRVQQPRQRGLSRPDRRKPACRSPIRPRWRSRSTARSASPGAAIWSPSNAPAN